MGCGGHSTLASSHSFTIHLLILEKLSKNYLEEKLINGADFINKNKLIIQETSKENCEIVKKISIIKYIFGSFKKEFKELFENGKTIKYCIFFLYYHDNENKKICNYNDVYNIIPFDEMQLIQMNGLLRKVYVLDLRSANKNKLKIEDLMDQIKDDNEILEKVINVPLSDEYKANIKILEEEKKLEDEAMRIDTEDEMEIVDGIKLDINRDISKVNINSHLDKINNERITIFQIRKNHFSDLNLFKIILDDLQKYNIVRTFNFSDNFNTTGFDDGWQLLIDFLKNNKSIRNLNLGMSFLYDKYLSELFKVGLKYKKIINLDLSSNFITYQGCKKIGDWLKVNKTLKSLNLQQNTMNEFKKEGADFILDSLITHPRISNLDLSNMILTGLGSKMSEFIKVTKTLKELKIQNVRMNLDDYILICNSLTENETITDLNISENNCGSDKALESVALFVNRNKTIKNLRMDNLGISMKNYSLQIFEAFKINNSIVNISLNENNKIKFKILFEVFVANMNLKFLSFVVNQGRNFSKEDEELIEKFKIARNDVNLKI